MRKDPSSPREGSDQGVPFIPFNKPDMGEAEKQAVLAALGTGYIGGNGPVSRELEARLEELFGVKHAQLTTSCSDALELAMMSMGVGPGDEVIMPSMTFVSTANAVIRERGRPVFADIEADTFNLDPACVEQLITPATRGIVPVHYAGQGCDMVAINELAEARGLWVVEDAAQGVGALFEGQYLGTIGDVGCYSFHATKNISCGEGGAFLTDDDDIARRAEIIREKGTNRSAFLRGEVDKYTWVDVGSSFIPSDLLSALALAQLDRLGEITDRRVAIWQRYYDELGPLAETARIVLPRIDRRATINGHIFAFRTVPPERRDELLRALRQRGIQATFHYVPLHSSPFARRHLAPILDLPVTDLVSRSLVRLPIYSRLTDDEQTYIIETLYDLCEDW
jgi:dTDP-4-amino-4,6-dideoxygalactose transaminase